MLSRDPRFIQIKIPHDKTPMQQNPAYDKTLQDKSPINT